MPTNQWVIVYAGGTADAAALRDLLEAAGISSRLDDEVMGTVLIREDRLDDAREIVAAFGVENARPASPPFEPWECPCCHEQNDGTFDICWNCQTERL